MADDQQFCLRWNEFQSNMVSSFKHLREEKSFTDVTLACDGQTCKAHKMVLSACSPYFKALLEVCLFLFRVQTLRVATVSLFMLILHLLLKRCINLYNKIFFKLYNRMVLQTTHFVYLQIFFLSSHISTFSVCPPYFFLFVLFFIPNPSFFFFKCFI